MHCSLHAFIWQILYNNQKAKGRRPFMKRIIFFALLSALILFATACSRPAVSTTTGSAATTNTTTATTTPRETNLAAPDITVWYRQNKLDDVIGPDLPENDYVLIAYECGTKASYQLFEYDEDGEKAGDLIEGTEFDACAKVSVQRGQVLVSENLIIYKAGDVAPRQHADGAWFCGLYEVGKDIPAGTYAIKACEAMAKSWTHLAIMQDLDNKADSLISQTQVDPYEPITAEFEEGQFVLMRNVYAEAAGD